MPLTQLIIILVVVGVVLWLINAYIPMQATIKRILNVVVIIVVVIWLLSVFGVISSLTIFVLASKGSEHKLNRVKMEKICTCKENSY